MSHKIQIDRELLEALTGCAEDCIDYELDKGLRCGPRRIALYTSIADQADALLEQHTDNDGNQIK